eukprot:876704-Lingulodinium_polyedra.AAC.1
MPAAPSCSSKTCDGLLVAVMLLDSGILTEDSSSRMTPQLQHSEKQWKTKRRQQAFKIPITPLSSFN